MDICYIKYLIPNDSFDYNIFCHFNLSYQLVQLKCNLLEYVADVFLLTHCCLLLHQMKLLQIFFRECDFKGVVWAKMVKIIKFPFFAQKVSSGMGASHPKFLGG